MPEIDTDDNIEKSTTHEGKDAKSHAKSASSSASESLDSAKQSSTQAKEALRHASKVVSDAASGAKQAASASAHDVGARVEDKLSQAKDHGRELLHDAEDTIGRSYEQASELAHDAADEVRTQALAASRYARRTGQNGVSFVGAHVLPLTVIGLGVGWLAVSMRSHARSRHAAAYAQPRHMPSLGGEYREARAVGFGELHGAALHPQAIATDGTSDSPKLMGVRTIAR